MAQLQPASWRGVPFAVFEAQDTAGRKVAVKDFPYRDLPEVEDLGRAIERLSLRCFINGDDVYQQRNALRTACNTAGPGDLVYPSRGTISVALESSSFQESVDEGGNVHFELVFVVVSTTADLAPSQADDTQDDADDAADDADDASSEDFGDRCVDAFHAGVATVHAVASTVQHYVGEVRSVIGDAQRVYSSVRGIGTILSGSVAVSRYDTLSSGIGAAGFGRSAGAGILGGINAGLSDVRKVSAGVTALIGQATTVASTVERAGNTVANLVSFL